ncbi:PqiC family protein [Cardiobacteriaceae bacterium TAE3-ERU3]|nr:PqiC family protein [Cardiobacteriaceae bacterium TAE3-ERU3]
MKHKLPLMSLILGVSAILSGCASETITYHTLRALPSDNSMVLPSNSEQPIIALRNLSLPGYLDDQDIVYLKGSSQVVHVEGQQWAEPLSENLRNIFVERLKNITANPRILAFPLANNIRPERIIDVQINDFVASRDDNKLLIRSNWQITQPGKNQQTPPGYEFNRDYPLQDDSIDALMRGYQQATADLTTAISDTLK